MGQTYQWIIVQLGQGSVALTSCPVYPLTEASRIVSTFITTDSNLVILYWFQILSLKPHFSGAGKLVDSVVRCRLSSSRDVCLLVIPLLSLSLPGACPTDLSRESCVGIVVRSATTCRLRHYSVRKRDTRSRPFGIKRT